MIPPRTGYYQYEIRQNVKRAQYYSWHDRIEGQYVPLVSECYLSKQLLGISKFLGMLFEASRRHTARGYPGDLHSLSGFKSVLSIHRLHPPLRSFHDPSLPCWALGWLHHPGSLACWRLLSWPLLGIGRSGSRREIQGTYSYNLLPTRPHPSTTIAPTGRPLFSCSKGLWPPGWTLSPPFALSTPKEVMAS